MKYFRVVIPVLLIACALIYFFVLKSDDYEKLADKITIKTAQKLSVENGLFLIGTGGKMMDDIQMMYMGFEYFHPINIDRGRELLLSSIEEYLTVINSDEKVRPYLHEFPFTANNIEIGIWILNSDGSKVASDKIRYIHANHGILSYYMDGEEEYSRKTVHEETYNEALKTSE